MKLFSLFISILFFALSTNSHAIGTGTRMSLGLHQTSLSGNQAEGSGTGLSFRVGGLTEVRQNGLQSGIFYDMKSADLSNEAFDGTFKEDGPLFLSSSYLKMMIGYNVLPALLLAGEIGLGVVNVDTDENTRQFGSHSFGLAAIYDVTESISINSNFDYHAPITERTNGVRSVLKISSLSFGGAYRTN